MENTKNECVSHTYSRHIYRISTLVSMITSRIKLIDMAAKAVERLLLCSYGPKTCNFYKCSVRSYKGSMGLFRTLVLTNEITVFVTSRI